MQFQALNQTVSRARPESASTEQSLPSLEGSPSGRSDDTVICPEETTEPTIPEADQSEAYNIGTKQPDPVTPVTHEAPAQGDINPQDQSFTKLRTKRRSSGKLNEDVTKQIVANVEAGTPTFNIIPGTSTDDVIGMISY